MDDLSLDNTLCGADPAAAISSTADRDARLLARATVGRNLSKRRRAAALVGFSAAVVTSAGIGVAAAGPGVLNPLTHVGWPGDGHAAQRLSDGEVCEQGFRVLPDTDRGYTEEHPSVLEAREFLATLDYSSLNLETAIFEHERSLAEAEWVGSGEPKPSTVSGVESAALAWHVFDLTREHLQSAGLDAAAVRLEGATGDCPPALELD